MIVKYITSQAILDEEVIPSLAQADILGLDIETYGLNPRKSDIITIQLSDAENIWVIDVRKVNPLPLLQIMGQTKPLFVGHNLKFDLAFLQHKYGFIPTRIFDTMIAYGIRMNGLDNHFISLRDLLKLHLDITLDKDIRRTFRFTYDALTNEQIEYAADDVRYLHKLLHKQVALLESDGLIETAQLEFNLIPVVVDMELAGIVLDVENWELAMKNSLERAATLGNKIANIVGDTAAQTTFFDVPAVNPRSQKQMLLAFRSLGIDIDSTSKDVLQYIKHPLASTLLEYRKYYKLGSTYGKNFVNFVDSDGKIHAEFNQMGTVSGRFSSKGPNLQNLPRNIIYRKCFVAGDNNILLTADYHQIEYKVAALLSEEQSIINEYKKGEADFHRLTASKLFETPFDAVTKEQRFAGKTCNFGTIFGISKFGLARNLNVPVDKAEVYLANFKNMYPKLNMFMRKQADLAQSNGFTSTVIGRRRYYPMPDMNLHNYAGIVSKIRREAGNMPVQGTAADIMKVALIKVNNAIKPYNSHIINTIHDEMIVECPIGYTSTMIPILHNEMEAAAKEIMGDKIRWDISLIFGNSWGKA